MYHHDPPAWTGGSYARGRLSGHDRFGRRRFRHLRRAFATGLDHRQLQHGRALAFAKLRHQHMASVGKFDRVMVTVGYMGVDLIKLTDPPIGGSSPDPPV